MREISLNSSERTILECLWENSPRTMIEIWHALEAKTGWTKSTANTLIGNDALLGDYAGREGWTLEELLDFADSSSVATAASVTS